jgi:antirestriction protein ArdC
MARDLYNEVSTRIAEQLARGVVPWERDWSATAGNNAVANAVTKRAYSGVNVVLLWQVLSTHGYHVPRFLTFKQALELGGNVRKGEHGHKVYLVKRIEARDDDNADSDNPRQITMLREYTVFNVAQCDGLPARVMEASAGKPRNNEARDVDADEFLRNTGADIREGGDPYYAPGADFISLPRFEAYRHASGFYATAFHELTHWTGHATRLGRDFRGRFGDRHYAAEELVAELGAAFLCAEFGFDNGDRHAAYIASWIELLKADKRAFFTACSKAQAATDYLRSVLLAEEPIAQAA